MLPEIPIYPQLYASPTGALISAASSLPKAIQGNTLNPINPTAIKNIILY